MLWEQFVLKKEERFQRRIRFLGLLIVVGFGVLLLRLAYLQLLQGKRYVELSARNRVRLVPIKAQRGLIYDRQGELLAQNISSFSVFLIPAALPKDPAELAVEFDLLQDVLGVEPEDIQTRLRRRKWRDYEPVRLKGGIDRATAIRLEEYRPSLPGVLVQTESEREYKYQSLAFHALGYVGEISEQELALREDCQAGDILGQAGVEKQYDSYLRGRNGWLHIEVDALGRQMGILGREAPWPGHNLVLTLDQSLQAKAEAVLGEAKGVILVENVGNGEILAMASSPTFDPNAFTRGLTTSVWEKLRKNQNFPLTNRAVQGLYPPGSIFKIVTLAAGLGEKVVAPGENALCRGVFWISTWPYRCWNESGHGYVNAHRAIVESCDIYFYHLGLKLKVEKLGQWARAFGFGKSTGVDLPGESAGLVPTAQWKERTQNMPWFPGNTVMMSIGQGYILATPLQLLNSVAAVANRGIIYRPHLLRQVITRSGTVIYEGMPEVLQRVSAEPETWSLLQRSLADVVQSRRGTGKAASIRGVRVAGKTATAQNPHGEDHAGFVAYAPADRPEIAVVVYLENAGGGGSQAAPMAREVMETYFKEDQHEPLADLP